MTSVRLMADTGFPPNDAAWQERVDAIDPGEYARTRNHLLGAVTRISPYLTHGFVSLPEVHQRLTHRLGRVLGPQDKLYAEFGWREFFHHVWRHAGEGILQDMRPGLPGVRYRNELPADVLAARTGLPVIDQAVRVLYDTGYLHNHARMWLASYLVHLRKVHWRVGADWMQGHLLDGDLASNHLSWQWVAATFSAKPYLFNAENVARFAPRSWHSDGTVIDTSYEALEAVARSAQTAPLTSPPVSSQTSGARAADCVSPPPVTGIPAPVVAGAFDPTEVDRLLAGESQELEWVHPWALSARTDGRPRLGVLHAGFHSRFPWSERRWHFVITRMREVCDAIAWMDPSDPHQLERLRRAARGACMTATRAPGYAALGQFPGMQERPVPRLLPEPARPCRSFSAFYKEATARRTSTPIR